MKQYPADIMAILAKPASVWDANESRKIAALVKAGERADLRAAMIEVRGGEKPQTPITE